MSYPSDPTDNQWDLLESVFNVPEKRGRKHADDLRTVPAAMMYVALTGCQWRYLAASLGPWTRVWSQFRRWSSGGTWAQALTVLHAAARTEAGRTDETPSMFVIDTHLACGAWNGGFTFLRPARCLRSDQGRQTLGRRRCDRAAGGPAGRARLHPRQPGQRADAGALNRQGVTNHLELVLVDRGVTAAAGSGLGRHHDLEVRRVGCEDKQSVFRTIQHAWRIEVAHGPLGRSRRLAKSFENTIISATVWL